LPNFVYDNLSLAYPKTDLVPLGAADHTKYIIAADWNDAMQACVDIRGAVTNGKYFGFDDQASDPAPTALTTSWLWVRASDGQLIHRRPDATSRSLADKNSSFLPAIDNLYTIGSASFRWASMAVGDITALSVRITNGGSGTSNYLEFGSGVSVAVSASNQARVRYDTVTATLQYSVNGGAWTSFTAAASVNLDGFARDTGYRSLFSNGTTLFDDDMSADPRPAYGLNLAPKLTLSTGTVNFTVGAGSGYAVVGAVDFKLFTWASTAKTLTATAGSARIDLILANTATEPAIIEVLNGTASGTPQPPAVPAGKVALFEVFVPSSTSVVEGAYWYRRLNRRLSFPYSQMWGVLHGLNPAWSTATATADASYAISEELNAAVIDGELIQGYGLVGEFNDSINPPTNTSGSALKPFYIYAVGGFHNPMSAEDTRNYISPSPAALAIVFSTTPPDAAQGCASAAMNISSLGARGAISKLGAVYIGVGYTRNASGTTRKVSVAYDGDWVFGRGECFARVTGNIGGGTLAVGPTPQAVTITIPTAQSPRTATAVFTAVVVDSPDDYTQAVLVPPMTLTSAQMNPAAAFCTANSSAAPVYLSHEGGVSSPPARIPFTRSSSAGGPQLSTIVFNDIGSSTVNDVILNVIGWNMNVPRITGLGRISFVS
jgi:hypothetical protein